MNRVEDDKMATSSDDEDDHHHHQRPPPTPQKRRHSDEEAASSKRQATNQPTSTYASITKQPQATQPRQVPNLIPTHADRHRRTLILRRLPYGTTTDDILHALQDEFDMTQPDKHIDAILRDKDDRRRFYVTFNRYEDKRHVAEKGFSIGDFTIPGQRGDVSGLIPYPTYYITETDVHNLLRPYGDNITGHFRRDKHGIRTGGYTFNMDLRPGQTLPKTVTLYNETMNVFDKDDKRQCTTRL